MKYMWLFYLVLSLNLCSFLMFGLDKRRAIKNKRRISEKTLILSAVLFGAIGACLGMYVFHHKTRKAKFFITVPTMVVLQFIMYIYIYINV